MTAHRGSGMQWLEISFSSTFLSGQLYALPGANEVDAEWCHLVPVIHDRGVSPMLINSSRLWPPLINVAV